MSLRTELPTDEVDVPLHDPLEDLRHVIEHAAHLLPSQGPITVFVHHNTLHAFEHLSFQQGVTTGSRLLGCEPWMPENFYRQQLDAGRIRVEDLEAVLLEDLGDEADRLVACFCTRYSLRLAMLRFPLRSGSGRDLRWVIAETEALRKFHDQVPASQREKLIVETRHWVTRDLRTSDSPREQLARETLGSLLTRFNPKTVESWSDRKAEEFTLGALWQVCRKGVRQACQRAEEEQPGDQPLRHRDLLLQATGTDADLRVHEILIRLTSAYLDQGFADWELPERAAGLYRAFLSLYSLPGVSPTRWLSSICREARRLSTFGIGPLESIQESLSLLGVEQHEREELIVQTLLALRGWAGMIWQMETNADWLPHPAPRGSLLEFLAVRLILDRLSLEESIRELGGPSDPLSALRARLRNVSPRADADRTELRTFVIFQLAQVLGWKPADLLHMVKAQWRALIREVDDFDELERRRVFQLAYERKYRNEALDALVAHSRRSRLSAPAAREKRPRPPFQLTTCIDDREESFRRHLEEIAPACETFGVPGFYGVAMNYRGATDAHFKPLCPVVIKPVHYVTEEPLYSRVQAEKQRTEARRRIGRATHQTHRGSRTILGGLLTGLLGSLAAFPLVARVLFPGTTARLRKRLSQFVEPPLTQVRYERLAEQPGQSEACLGYSLDEMANIVEGVLRSIGLTKNLARIVAILGHGSTSLNNPHESAYSCGACSGSRGGPNARVFAQMANDFRVRQKLGERGLHIPADTRFVGAYHDTTNDEVRFFDLDDLPASHRPDFEQMLKSIDAARERNAQERCRRFESADLNIAPGEALRHVESRPQDLSQARPEYNHATNALTFVGRREWSRGLFLDRRCFMNSYDSRQDPQGKILEGILRAAVPVCAGISLEYYFSTVDPEGYGCGSKLPHNITSLIGVMTGAESDLRPGLSQQMTEIHEPMRNLFVIETTPANMQRIINDNPGIAQLVCGDWVQLATFDPENTRIHLYDHGEFVPYQPTCHELPLVNSSRDWYRGWRDHLGFASIREPGGPPVTANGKSGPT